jgi:hypothetical protein
MSARRHVPRLVLVSLIIAVFLCGALYIAPEETPTKKKLSLVGRTIAFIRKDEAEKACGQGKIERWDEFIRADTPEGIVIYGCLRD